MTRVDRLRRRYGRRVGASLAALGGAAGGVDLDAGGGALAFPEQNHQDASDTDRQAYAYQTAGSNFDNAFPASSAFWCAFRLPIARSRHNRQRGLFGSSLSDGSEFALALFGNNHANGRVLKGWASDGVNDVAPTSAAIDEDGVLAVLKHSSGGDVSIDWYSLADGTKHAGSTVASGSFANIGSFAATQFGIGAVSDATSITPPLSNPNGAFTGEILHMGYVAADIADASWQGIIAGTTDLETVIGANGVWVREYDETTGLLGKPSWASGDSTAATTHVGDGFRRGSHIARQGSAYVVMNPIVTGQVFGCLPGASPSAAVTISGDASGDVEVQVFRSDTGAIVLDWTAVTEANFEAGTTITVDGTAAWLHVRARLAASPAVIGEMREFFGVGYRVGFLGQSELEKFFEDDDQALSIADADFGKISFAVQDDAEGVAATSNSPNIERIGPSTNLGDGWVGFLAQWKTYGNDFPLMLVNWAEAGTGIDELVDDADSGRDWDGSGRDIEGYLDFLGDQFTGVLLWWVTNNVSSGADFGDFLDAVFRGTGPEAVDNDFDSVLRAGYKAHIVDVSRATINTSGPFEFDAGGTGSETRTLARQAQRDWADDESETRGPAAFAYLIEDAGGPHQKSSVANSNDRIGPMLAIGVARMLGLDTTQDPVIQSAAFVDADTRTAIDVTISLPNGGSLVTEDGTDVFGFELEEWGATRTNVTVAHDYDAEHSSALGFTAAIQAADNGDGTATVRLTKDSGAWKPSMRLRYMPGGPMGYGTSFSDHTQLELIEGALAESVAANDVLGVGRYVLPLAEVMTVAGDPTEDGIDVQFDGATQLEMETTIANQPATSKVLSGAIVYTPEGADMGATVRLMGTSITTNNPIDIVKASSDRIDIKVEDSTNTLVWRMTPASALTVNTPYLILFAVDSDSGSGFGGFCAIYDISTGSLLTSATDASQADELIVPVGDGVARYTIGGTASGTQRIVGEIERVCLSFAAGIDWTVAANVDAVLDGTTLQDLDSWDTLIGGASAIKMRGSDLINAHNRGNGGRLAPEGTGALAAA